MKHARDARSAGASTTIVEGCDLVGKEMRETWEAASRMECKIHIHWKRWHLDYEFGHAGRRVVLPLTTTG